MAKSLTVVHIASECAPYAKSGGLGDVVNALPKALAKLGHRVAVIMPDYGYADEGGEVAGQFEVILGGKNYPARVRGITTEDGVPLFFIGNRELFGKQPNLYGYDDDGLRFLFFNAAALQFLDNEIGTGEGYFAGGVDVLHCHDWHTGIIPQLLALNHHFEHLQSAATLFTIHNLAFQGPRDWWTVPKKRLDTGRNDPRKPGADWRYLNFARRGIMNADAVSTVSERYAMEILTPQFGQGLHRLLRSKRENVFGIINGVDYAVFNPQFDPHVAVPFDATTMDKKMENKLLLQRETGLEVSAEIPLLGMANRLTEQKGFRLLMQIMPHLLKLPVQLIMVGNGDREYLQYFKGMARRYPERIAVCNPFTEEMASKVYAGSDMYLMPSRFEPCGISQLISLRYGSVPIVHETGGLHDTITNFNPRTGRGNGFVFSSYTKEDFLVAIVRALETYQYPEVWKTLAAHGMRESFSWDLPAKKYTQLYQFITKKAQADLAKQAHFKPSLVLS